MRLGVPRGDLGTRRHRQPTLPACRGSPFRGHFYLMHRGRFANTLRDACQALGQVAVPDRIGDAIQRAEPPPRPATIRGRSLSQCVGVVHDDRIQRRPIAVVGPDLTQIGLDQFDIGDPSVLSARPSSAIGTSATSNDSTITLLVPPSVGDPFMTAADQRASQYSRVAL